MGGSRRHGNPGPGGTKELGEKHAYSTIAHIALQEAVFSLIIFWLMVYKMAAQIATQKTQVVAGEAAQHQPAGGDQEDYPKRGFPRNNQRPRRQRQEDGGKGDAQAFQKHTYT